MTPEELELRNRYGNKAIKGSQLTIKESLIKLRRLRLCHCPPNLETELGDLAMFAELADMEIHISVLGQKGDT